MTAGSRFADRAAAVQAVALALPSIEAALRDPAVSGLRVLHVVVMDPAIDATVGATGAGFEQAILYEQSIGDRARWDVDYGDYAREKARQTWQHKMDGRRLQLLHPYRLAEADRQVWGSVWLDGIVVAASGAMPQWDEAFALSVAGHLRALALTRAEAARAA